MNTLVVSLDAVRRDHLGQYGYDRDTLPAADRLLAEGATRFDQAVVNGTYTGISLPSLLTSRHLGDDAVREGPTVASALPEDVRTGAIHSNTFFSSKFDGIHGFDIYEDFFGQADHDEDIPLTNRASRAVFDAVRPRLKRLGLFETARRVQEAVLPPSLIHEVAIFESAETTTDRALEFVEGTDGEFFLWVHYMDPHRPYAINADPPAYAPDLSRSEIIDLMAEAGVRPGDVTDDQRDLLVDLYDSAIRYTSDHVARLFDGLADAGVWDDTAVVLTADHGEEFGEHGMYFHRNRPYDELVRVPLFLRVPGGVDAPVDPGSDAGAPPDQPDVVSDQRELLDVAPTVCSLHGVDPPAEFLGTDLRAGGERRAFTTGSFRDDVPVAAARWDGWKYIAVGEDGELYDLDGDPGEREDLAAASPDRAREYRAAIPDRLLAEPGEGVPDEEDVDADARQRLEDLGYLE
jgi:arylsulfatase A-like enzyme